MEADQLAIQHLEAGNNILLTGGADVGKSYNLRKVLEWADEKGLNVARTAMTGMAYVALSRARNYEGPSITGWNPSSVHYNKQAFDFYMGLKNSGQT